MQNSYKQKSPHTVGSLWAHHSIWDSTCTYELVIISLQSFFGLFLFASYFKLICSLIRFSWEGPFWTVVTVNQSSSNMLFLSCL